MPDETTSAFEWTGLLPPVAVLAGSLVVLRLVKALADRHHKDLRNEPHFRTQVALMAGTLAAVVLVILTLPVTETTRGQLLNLTGLLVTAMLALSSTTLTSNMLAGLMVRSMRAFRPGDFVRVGDCFGRVTLRGLFYTEIQTEQRDLTTIPNQYLIANPVTVVRSSGTIVSTELSLGYDVAHGRIEDLLRQAAQAVELQDPFVHVRELGDFSVTYRVSGFLADASKLLSTQSRLRAEVLDALHGGGVEIVSPTYMNQRRLPDGARVLPRVEDRPPPAPTDEVEHETIVFDKAEGASRIEELVAEHERLSTALKELEAKADKAEVGEELEAHRARITALEATIAALREQEQEP